MPPGVKAISFDIWKTLVVGNSQYTWPRLEIVFGYVGILGRVEKDALIAAYKAAEKHLNHEAEVTGIDNGMQERIEFVLQALNISDVRIPSQKEIDEIQKRCAIIRMLPGYRPTLTEPGLVETLTALKDTGYVLGTLSNTGMGDSIVAKPILEYYRLDKLFEVSLFSCDDGRAKPNPELFKRMTKELGFTPAEVLHVGDNINADCRAAEAGLNVALYAPKGPPGPCKYPFIRSMRELLN